MYMMAEHLNVMHELFEVLLEALLSPVESIK